MEDSLDEHSDLDSNLNIGLSQQPIRQKIKQTNLLIQSFPGIFLNYHGKKRIPTFSEKSRGRPDLQ